MSVIVAKDTFCWSETIAPPVSNVCIPAVSITHTILAGNTLSIDGLNTSQWRAIKWHVIVTTASASKTKGYEIFATHRNGIDPHFNVYAIVGDRVFAQTPNVIITSGQLTLQITNNEAESAVVYVTRFAIPIVSGLINLLPTIMLTKTSSVVLGGDTCTIDWLPAPDMNASKWYITITDNAGRRTISQVFGIKQLGTPAVDSTHYGWTGDISLSYDIGAVLVNMDGIGLQLLFTNSDIIPYRVDVTRIPINVSVPNLPPSCSTETSGLSIWNPDPVIIPAGSTVIIDNTVNLPGHLGIKWLIGTIESITNNSMAFEVGCTQVNLTTSYEIPYGYVGDYMNLPISTAVVGSNIELSMTNNQPNSVTVTMIRVPVSL